MATRKKTAKTRAKLPKTKGKKLKTRAKPRPRVKAKKKASPAPVDPLGSTQQIAIAEIVGDIEERMALDRLAD